MVEKNVSLTYSGKEYLTQGKIRLEQEESGEVLSNELPDDSDTSS